MMYHPTMPQLRRQRRHNLLIAVVVLLSIVGTATASFSVGFAIGADDMAQRVYALGLAGGDCDGESAATFPETTLPGGHF